MIDQFCAGPFLKGCGTGASLIIAIGAQNAFVIKQGIQKNHRFVTALFCALADILLITLGVTGVGQALTCNPLFIEIARWGGILFLSYYGFRAFRLAIKSQGMQLEQLALKPSLPVTITTLFTVTFLNPHAYLDAMVLMGSIGAQFQDFERPFFALGAISASFVWFFGLTYGAQVLRPLFQKPLAWRILDLIIAFTLWLIALSLLIPGFLC